MEATRRWWTLAAVVAVFAALAVVVARPVLLVGSAVLGAWLLAHQYAFVRDLQHLGDGLAVEQSVAPEVVSTGEPATGTLEADVPGGAPVPVRVSAEPPVGTTGSEADDRTVALAVGDGSARTTFPVRAAVAGRYAFEPARVEATDDRGLFREDLARGSTTRLTVEPRAPRTLHVGEGGDEIATAFGEHDAGRIGSGLEPAELREYVAGDAAGRIDWKATARLGHPYVREFEAETDRTTVVLFDHRSSTARGRPGELTIDYLREVALAFLNSARELDDPVGLLAVGDEGITEYQRPRASPGHYAALRSRLLEFVPTGADPGQGRPASRSPAAAHEAAERLRADGSSFGRTLGQLYADASSYVDRIADRPLFETVRTRLTRQRGSVWTVLFTDDSDPAELREAVKLARRGDDHVLVFLAPGVLFEPGGLADLEAAYERYVAFEELRRDLAGLDRVMAFEVGPGDRLAAVLEAGRRRRAR